MKNLTLFLAFIITGTLLVQCTNTSQSHKKSLLLNNQTDIDYDGAAFLKAAVSGGMMEVQLGQLAMQKGQSERVKNFGKLMLADHSKMNQKLNEIGAKKHVLLPDTLDTESLKELNRIKLLRGAEFDLNYMRMMVEDHQKDISSFQGAADNREKILKKFATESLPVLKMHLDSAKSIYKSLNPPVQ